MIGPVFLQEGGGGGTYGENLHEAQKQEHNIVFGGLSPAARNTNVLCHTCKAYATICVLKPIKNKRVKIRDP